jgi:cyclopropane-fatty-acyl-phospholipid synthase
MSTWGSVDRSNIDSEDLFEKLLLRKIVRLTGRAPIRVRLGEREFGEPPDRSAGTLVIRNRRTLGRLALDPEVGFGDGYMEGQIEVEGDLVRFLEQAYRVIRLGRMKSWHNRLFSRWLTFVQGNTRSGSARNIHHHYDLSNDFYKLWLDRRMVYTCAYFPAPEVSLEEAQEAKMEHVCRKLQLQPGERVVEAGCGWGSLALYMAKHYGVTVRAFNISREQIQYAQAQAKKEGLAGQVEFVEDDYRSVPGGFDAFVSVGMLEHVGREHYGELAEVIRKAIGNTGRGLLHFIGRNRPSPFSTWIRKHVFPGAYAPTLREAMEIFERNNYAVLDVENLRLHYARTLEHWLERYERAVDQVKEMFGPEFVRMWRLYLAGSIAGFRVGTLQLFQVVFAGPERREIPWTRAHVYSDSAATGEAGMETEWSPARY